MQKDLKFETLDFYDSKIEALRKYKSSLRRKYMPCLMLDRLYDVVDAEVNLLKIARLELLYKEVSNG